MSSKGQSSVSTPTETKAEFKLTKIGESGPSGHDSEPWALRYLESVAHEMKSAAVDSLNKSSPSYKQFEYSTTEAAELAACSDELKQIQQKINELGSRQEALLAKHKKLAICDDLPLQKVFASANILNDHGDGHYGFKNKIACRINKEYSLCVVSFDTDIDNDVIGEVLFKPYLKSPCKSNRHVWTHHQGRNRVNVVFQLSDRENLMQGIQKDSHELATRLKQLATEARSVGPDAAIMAHRRRQAALASSTVAKSQATPASVIVASSATQQSAQAISSEQTAAERPDAVPAIVKLTI